MPVVAVMEKLELLTGQVEKLAYGINLLKNVRETIRSEVPQARNIAKQTAQALLGKLSVVYGATGYRTVVAERLKNQISSNAKSAACRGNFPDVVEGTICGWELAREQCKGVAFLFITDADDRSEVADQMAAAREALEEYATVNVEMKGNTNIEKLLYGIYIADFISCYLAFLYGVDPTATELTTRIKANLEGEELTEQSTQSSDNPQV